MVDVVEIIIWGQLVGAARWDNDLQLASFQYDKKFLNTKNDLSPIKMPLRNGEQIYSFPELRKQKNQEVSTFKGLPGLLADSLPDRYGNELINIWLAQEGRPPNSMNPVEQLCFIGSRGMGALEFKPAQLRSTQQPFTIEISNLVDMAQKLLSSKQNFKTNFHQDKQKALTEILTIGTSAGGARPKAVIAFNKNTGEVRSGQTKSPKGFEHWLIKLDGVSDTQFGASHGFGRVEYAYHLMAKDCGVTMMECRLLEETNRAHFMTKRFDRDGNDVKHHIQTLCGIQHFDYNNLQGFSYEQLFQTMRILRMTYTEAEQMFRRLVFNVMATNYDDHTKNFSFMLKENSKWELSPSYDICYSYDPDNVWVSQHTLSINGKHKDIKKADLMKIAADNNIKNAEKIIESIKTVVSNWNKYALDAKVSEQLKSSISSNLIAPTFDLEQKI